MKSFIRKIWILIFMTFFFYLFLMKNEQRLMKENDNIPIKYDGTWRNLTYIEKNDLSVLGRILYLEEEPPTPQYDKNFLILFWKYGKYLTKRHFDHFTKETFDPLEECSVKNCKVTFDDVDLNKADIVIFHLHRTKGLQDIPLTHENEQIWAFLTDESPYHTFLNSKIKLSEFDGIFNWSMSYKMNSDIPVPYGRTRKYIKKLQTVEIPIKRKDKLVTILGSNCGGKNHRWEYVKKLNKSIDVDVYGRCGNRTACPGHFKDDCPVINDYLFYLSFENSDCKEYITEKVFWNAYHKNSIPVIMGYKKEIYEKLLPPNSFLHVDDFATPKDLADFILSLNRTGDYKRYYEWKNNYEIVNEHGYFKSKSFHICRICEALNFNDKTPKVYDKLDNFLSKSKDCSLR